jgi:hypothetical protein
MVYFSGRQEAVFVHDSMMGKHTFKRGRPRPQIYVSILYSVTHPIPREAEGDASEEGIAGRSSNSSVTPSGGRDEEAAAAAGNGNSVHGDGKGVSDSVRPRLGKIGIVARVLCDSFPFLLISLECLDRGIVRSRVLLETRLGARGR